MVSKNWGPTGKKSAVTLALGGVPGKWKSVLQRLPLRSTIFE
jgi:hypothetical protein